VAHGAALRVLSKNPLIADQVAANHRHADLTPRERAICDFALKVATASAAIDGADFEALKPHGLTESDVWDVGAIAAFFSLSNRMANMAAMRPNREFYTMGRG
jgi:uncharacterized peroxidase-related enzyme